MEPPHVHVAKEGKEAKYWMAPIAVARPGRIRGYEINEIGKILARHREAVMEAWQKGQNKRVDR